MQKCLLFRIIWNYGKKLDVHWLFNKSFLFETKSLLPNQLLDLNDRIFQFIVRGTDEFLIKASDRHL
jgi:hypothetical protein